MKILLVTALMLCVVSGLRHSHRGDTDHCNNYSSDLTANCHMEFDMCHIWAGRSAQECADLYTDERNFYDTCSGSCDFKAYDTERGGYYPKTTEDMTSYSTWAGQYYAANPPSWALSKSRSHVRSKLTHKHRH